MDRGDTQKAFASLIGKHVGMLQKWELGTAVPGGDALAGFASTGVNLHWLLTGEGEMRAGFAPFDIERLARAVATVQEGLQAVNGQVPPERFAQLVAAAYAAMAQPGATGGGLAQFLSLAAGSAASAPGVTAARDARTGHVVTGNIVTGSGNAVAGKGHVSTVSHQVHHHGATPGEPAPKTPRKPG